MREIISGGEMISRGAVDGGVNFFAGYPITPANTIYSAMLKKLKENGNVAVGMSDEISALSLCIGASMRGAKAMTATSAPGFCLMVEGLGYAFMTETPLLLVVTQRLGPSTGAATQSSEGDILLAGHAISGGYHIPIVAPNSISSCYEITKKAINISEQFRTPVILLTQKDIVMSSQSVDQTAFNKIKTINRPSFTKNKKYKTYDFNYLKEVPPFVPVGSREHKTVVTGSMHDKSGRLSKNSPEAFEVAYHLREKIEGNVDEMALYKEDLNPGAKICVISFMATDLAARVAVKMARAQAVKINHLTLFTLFPICKKVILRAIKNCKTVVIPEENISGQYVTVIGELLSGKTIKRVNKIGGLISPYEIFNVLDA